jgi:hypothetical protein
VNSEPASVEAVAIFRCATNQDSIYVCGKNSMSTTSVNKVIMPLALVFLAATVAHADDAAIKRELLGYWASGRHIYWFKDDGVAYMMPRDINTTTNKWDVKNGLFYEDGRPSKIISLTRTQFKTQDVDGGAIYTLKRVTKEDANTGIIPR